MAHTAKNFDHLIGLDGFSEKVLKQHFSLYQGYCNKLNEIEEKLSTADRTTANYSFGEYSELKRREAVAFNGTYLHKLYFENLGPTPLTPDGALSEALKRDFGTLEAWERDMRACAISTPGWVLLTYNWIDSKLHHYILYEHHIGLPVHQKPLLALDCWEHAFMLDYGTAKAEYLNAFFKNVNWNVVEDRFARVLKHLK